MRLFPIFMAMALASCTAFDPIKSRRPDATPAQSAQTGGVKITFLGNTTLLISDGTTRLMVDGFLSRPGALRTLLGTIESDDAVVQAELKRSEIDRLDAILVGHTHHDHALDAPKLAELTGATVVGSRSYSHIHHGAGSAGPLVTVTGERETHRFGKFRVTFVASDHVSSFSCLQRAVEGPITAPVQPPARFFDYKCGEVYALHIDHPEGAIAVTTTAGAKKRQYEGLSADLLFLGIGLLSKESEENREAYWRETACVLDPDVVVPVHWDNFARKLSRGLMPPPPFVDDVEASFKWIGRKTAGRRLVVLDLREALTLRAGQIH